jgi:hypothetical protein
MAEILNGRRIPPKGGGPLLAERCSSSKLEIMYFLDSSRDSLPGRFQDLRLDIVGIIAILGDGGVTRNAQVAALSWYNNIPRLLPAPQALLKQERDRRLPTQSGTVVGVYSGNVRHDLNFFTSVLHPYRLQKYEVEFLQVDFDGTSGELYGARPWGELFCLSVVGCLMSLALIALSIYYQDGMSLLATIFLSMVSSLVGIGSHWKLDFPPPKVANPKEILPPGDIVIYYPNGALRVIRCTEQTSRLYFEVERCKYSLEDSPYRSIALVATIMLMLGVIFMSNATLRLQVAFASAYIILNALYWGVSAVNPLTNHWKHSFKITKFPLVTPVKPNTQLGKMAQDQPKQSPEVTGGTRISMRRRWRNSAKRRRGAQMVDCEMNDLGMQQEPDRTMTTALWVAIALTGTSKWLNDSTYIAPVSEAWKEWLTLADQKAKNQLQFRAGRIRSNINQVHASTPHPIHIRVDWDYKKALADILAKKKKDFPRPDLERSEPASNQGTPRPIMESITEVNGPDLGEPAST